MLPKTFSVPFEQAEKSKKYKDKHESKRKQNLVSESKDGKPKAYLTQ